MGAHHEYRIRAFGTAGAMASSRRKEFFPRFRSALLPSSWESQGAGHREDISLVAAVASCFVSTFGHCGEVPPGICLLPPGRRRPARQRRWYPGVEEIKLRPVVTILKEEDQ